MWNSYLCGTRRPINGLEDCLNIYWRNGSEGLPRVQKQFFLDNTICRPHTLKCSVDIFDIFLSYGYSLLCINGESITDAVLERFVLDELSCINLIYFIKSEIPLL